MSDYIPGELLTKILAYLPAKSLVRFTCVSKSWQSLITTSDFITTHLNQTTISNNNLGNHHFLLRYYYGNPNRERYSLHVDNDTFDQTEVFDFPFQSRGFTYFRVLGSCNGLVCLSDDYIRKTTTYILWNPSIRKSLTLPTPRFTFQTHGPCDDAIGFGFDSRNNDYKVVRLVFLQEEEAESPRVELFKLSTGYWETINATLDPSYLIFYNQCGSAFLNGAVHWSAYKRSICGVIVSFDLIDEMFREIKLPADDLGYNFVLEMLIAVCGEWLSFFHSRNRERYSDWCCDIWVMKEYSVVESWTKLYSYDMNGGLSKTLGFKRNGELLVAKANRQLVSYDPETQRIEYLGISDSHRDSSNFDPVGYSFYVGAYVESLVLLGYAKGPKARLKIKSRKRKNKRSKKRKKSLISLWYGIGPKARLKMQLGKRKNKRSKKSRAKARVSGQL